MRQGQQNRRGRGRSSSSSSSNNNNNHNNNGGRKPQNPLQRNFESSGPDVKIRGTAAQIAEKYMTLARDASSSGDFITAENYLQHAEHYNRIIMAAQAQAQPQPQSLPHQPAMSQHGYENGHATPVPQRIPAEGSSVFRDQPQPQPQFVPAAVPAEQPVIAESPAETPQPAPAAKEAEGGRRRRRRYPGNGADRAAGAPEGVSSGHPRTEDHPGDEAVA